MLSILALVAFAGIPGKAQAISGGAAAGIGVGAFFGSLVIANAMCCGCKKKCCDKNHDETPKKGKKARRAARAA